MQNLKVLVVLLLPLSLGNCKKWTRCELAIELKKYLDADDFNKNLGNWICVANSLSKLETSLNTTSSSDITSRSYGVFQANNHWWCEDDKSYVNIPFTNPCNEKCADLIDDDISNDINCAKIIKTSQSPDFIAWDSWIYDCQGKNLDQYKYFDNCPVTRQPTVPVILSTESNVTFQSGDKEKFIECQSTSFPLPEITWEYDEKSLSELRSQKLFHIPGAGRLIFPTITSFHDGAYTCIAKNFYGEARKVFYMKVKPRQKDEDSSFPYGLVIGLPLTILFIGGLLVLYLFRRLALRLNALTKAEIREFLEGQPDKLTSSTNQYGAENTNLHENIQYIPYDQKYDLSEDKLVKSGTTKILGEGQYGFVTKAVLDGRPVAVKSVKPNTEKLYIKALLSELKIMIYLGTHPHVVSLIGAVTEKLDRGMLHIVVELCENGDLQNCLRNRKSSFFSAVKRKGSNSNSQYENVSKRGNSACDYENVIMESAVDYANTNVITTADLINWCEQIAKGMAYLASKHCIHGDLAARNVLLDSNLNAKITDFGLSRQLYDYTNYVKKQQAPLPWRHMAYESLKQMSFSTESDVWSFGVTMWEVFSLGDVPYPGRSWSLDFVDELESGLRLLQPKFAPDFIYSKMMECWNLKMDDRPTFESLSSLEH